MTTAGNVLRAPEVDVDSVAVGLDQASGTEEDLGVVGTELNDQGTVRWMGMPLIRAVFWARGGFGEELCVKHWREAELGAVPSRECTPWKLGLVDHGGEDVAG